jgi:hypothetical protein
MWPITSLIFANILLAASVMACIGILCTQNRRDLVPGLLFGSLAILPSLLIYVFFIEVGVFGLSLLSVPPLLIGSLVIWRGFRTGRKGRDILSAVLVYACVYSAGIVLILFPTITRMLFSKLLPPTPIL